MAVRPKNRRRGMPNHNSRVFGKPVLRFGDTSTEALHAVDATKKRITTRYLKEPQPQRPRLERLAHVQGVLDLLVEEHI